ncbi:class I SAM-dependent methyltransferase [Microscilla marina]|uniref:Regulatory protein, putative n=1 Tax=Microscilla marina ATCC 23134 TaxID=313606 RepID=A1ZI54_MICM2|nr:class I SAM-dependent methyltransferase [Microscilla marina]EAY29722.1 regulatory protein, putative [Microscilla marina ATCC 23134]
METVRQLKKIIEKNGPDRSDYGMLDSLLHNLTDQDFVAIQQSDLLKNADLLKDDKSIMGHIFTKPYGYAGDFHIIDRIYTRNLNNNYVKWDQYSLENSAAQAVRNRKSYFQKLMHKKVKNWTSDKSIELLNVASGPARDLKELYDQLYNKSIINTTCVEMDAKAIVYAQNLNKAHLNHINFIQKNIFRYNDTTKYDVIWSAGLFDYFNDKCFVKVLNKMKTWLTHQGEIIIGNFNQDHNPSRKYMELFGDWFLVHRTKEEMIQLAEKAGFDRKNITVKSEAENVNLFLHIKQG